MNMLILLALMLPWAGAPASSTFNAAAVTAQALSPDVVITCVPLVPAPSRGLGKFGTGRSLVKVGTGRGLAKVGSSEPMIDPASTTQGEVVPEPPLPEKGESPAANTPDPQASKDDPSLRHKPVHPAPLVVQKEKFLPHVRDLITQGDRNMVNKNYTMALDQYFVAQQAEGMTGQSMMRLSGSLIAVGRNGDGIYQLKYYVEGGGRIYPEGFGFTQDESLAKRLADQVARNPFDADLLMSKAVYHYSCGETSHASEALASLRRVNPYHSCLKPLEKAVEKAGSKDVADDPDAGNQGDR
jgi:hypothetical protein